jgi:hypothetical protein
VETRSDEPSGPWPCDWEAAELAQLRRDAARSFRDNLIWLEEMTEFAERFAKAPAVSDPGFPRVKAK